MRLALTWRGTPAVAVLVQAALLVLFMLNTRPLETNGGLGYDGREYAAIVSWLRGDTSVVPHTPYSYRVVPSVLVAVSGLDVRLGFFVLNVLAMIGSSLVLLTMLRREGATPGRGLLLVLWYALLPTGLRYALIYPVLTDGVGIFLFVCLLAAAQAHRVGLFAALLVLGVLTREHLVLFAPLAVRSAGRRAAAQVAAFALPALAALALLRIAPPYPTSGPSSLNVALANVWSILTNLRGESFRLLASPLLTLGVLGGVALALPGAVAATLRQHGWAYAAALTVVTGAIGGLDHDRYLIWLAPLLLVAAARVAWPTRLSAVLTVLHLVATRAFIPLDGTTEAYLSFALIGMPLDQLALWTSVAAVAVLVAALAIRRWGSPHGELGAAVVART